MLIDELLEGAADTSTTRPVRCRQHSLAVGNVRMGVLQLLGEPGEPGGKDECLGSKGAHRTPQQMKVDARVRLHRARHIGQQHNPSRPHRVLSVHPLDRVTRGPVRCAHCGPNI